MQAGLPTARGVIQRAARASVWGSSLGLQDPAVFVTYSPLSESVIPFVLNCCSAIRWLGRSAVQRHRSSRVRWLGCSLCVLPPACCPLDLASCPLLQARRTVESARRILPNAFLPVVCPLPAACCHLDPLPCPCPLPTGPCLGSRGIPPRSAGRVRSSTSGYGFTADRPAALIAKNRNPPSTNSST